MIPAGKLPLELLREVIGNTSGDASLVVGPGPGLDATVIDLGGDQLLVATADPITFTAQRPAHYAVAVNANDVAVMGGTPRWFLATILLPPATHEAQVKELFAELHSACEAAGCALAGGHTEVTDAVARPVIAGTMLGTVERVRLITAAGVRPGDEIWLTGAIAVEGTAILCREAARAIRQAGVADDIIARGAALLDDPGISVIAAARIAADAGVNAMHDPTEGGVWTALDEMALASDCRLEIDSGSIPVLDETRIVCAALGLHPLGLLASGSLLMAVEPKGGSRLGAALDRANIRGTRIGAAIAGAGVQSTTSAVPTFSRDELARYLESR
jgi:hydrogenase expression/formation protein HypE